MKTPGLRSGAFPVLDCEVHIDSDGGLVTGELMEHLADIPEIVLESEGEEGWWNISISLTSDANLRQLHAEFLDDDSVTDVMSFMYGESGAGIGTFGEIVISVDRAVEQAADAGWSLQGELAFLSIHGILHLCGWVDDDEESRAAMLERQHEILATMNTDRPT